MPPISFNSVCVAVAVKLISFVRLPRLQQQQQPDAILACDMWKANENVGCEWVNVSVWCQSVDYISVLCICVRQVDASILTLCIYLSTPHCGVHSHTRLLAWLGFKSKQNEADSGLAALFWNTSAFFCMLWLCLCNLRYKRRRTHIYEYISGISNLY